MNSGGSLVVMHYTPGHKCPGCVVHHYSQFDGNYTLENLYGQFVENYTLDQIDGNYTLEKLVWTILWKSFLEQSDYTNEFEK